MREIAHEGRSIEAIQDSVRWFSNAYEIRPAMVRVFQANQKIKSPHIEVMAITVAFYAMAEALDLDINDLLTQAGNMKAELNGPKVNEWRAIIDYCKGEILNGRS